jgi:hypothetical protein
VHADHVLQQTAEARALDGHGQHVGVAVAQDAGAHAARLQLRQHLVVLGKGAEVAVLVHQPLFGGRLQVQPQARRRVAQPGAGELPEGLVALGFAPGHGAHRHQVRVLDLLVAPQLRQRLALARKQLLGQQGHAVHVKQRAIGIEKHGA